MPFVSSEARRTAADLDKCRIDGPPPVVGVRGPAAVVMGGDVGQQMFWVIIRMFDQNRSFPVFVERIDGDWEDRDALGARYKVGWCVGDAQPATRGARAFQRRQWRRDVPAFAGYDSRERAHAYGWGRDAYRTLALDEMVGAFRREAHLLPMHARELAGGAYDQHVQALVRTTEPDEFGQPIPAYRHARPADFAHAETYLTLAASRWGRWNGWWE